MNKLEKRGGFKFEKIAVSGGASQSDEICQIAADVFNIPLVRGKTYETSGLGAAIITAYGIHEFSTLDDAVKNMVKYSNEFKPNIFAVVEGGWLDYHPDHQSYSYQISGFYTLII